MAERYVRPTVAGWLTPTLIAPWITIYAAVTGGVLLGLDWGKAGKIAAWTAGMIAGSVWAFVFCALLVVTDLALLGDGGRVHRDRGGHRRHHVQRRRARDPAGVLDDARRLGSHGLGHLLEPAVPRRRERHRDRLREQGPHELQPRRLLPLGVR